MTCAGLSSALIPQHCGSCREIETKRVQYLTALILARCTSQWLFPDNPLRISLTILCLDFKTIIKHLHLWAVIGDLCFPFSYRCPWLSKGLWCAAASFGWVGYAEARVKLTGAGKQSQAESNSQWKKKCILRKCSFRASRLGHLRHRQRGDVLQIQEFSIKEMNVTYQVNVYIYIYT